MEYLACEVLGVYGMITAPIHELGHVIFGWLTLNPTAIIDWNHAGASRDGFIMSLGGYLFQIIFGAGLVWLLRNELFVYPVGIVQVAAALYVSTYQGDFPEGGFQHRAAQVIWLIATIAAFVVIIAAFITAKREKAAEEHRAARRILAEIDRYRRQTIGRKTIRCQAIDPQAIRGMP